MILKIRKYGDPVLKNISEKIEKIDDELLKLIDDMAETMYDAPGVGLAAPQVGINRRVVIIDIEGTLKKIINPEFLECKSKLEIGEEGCLSIPGIYEKVKRAEKVKIKYMNEKGEEVIEEAEGLLARAFQHEVDHLEGTLFVEKLAPVRKRMVSKKLQKMKKETLKDLKI